MLILILVIVVFAADVGALNGKDFAPVRPVKCAAKLSSEYLSPVPVVAAFIEATTILHPADNLITTWAPLNTVLAAVALIV